MSDNITERLKQIIVNDLDVNVEMNSIREDITLFEGGIGLDSIAIMEFVSLIEQVFGIEFSDEELGTEPFQSLTVLTEFILMKSATEQA